MKISELRAELEMKKMEIEAGLKERKPHEEIVPLYRQLKELQYDVIQEEIGQGRQKELDLA